MSDQSLSDMADDLIQEVAPSLYMRDSRVVKALRDMFASGCLAMLERVIRVAHDSEDFGPIECTMLIQEVQELLQ